MLSGQYLHMCVCVLVSVRERARYRVQLFKVIRLWNLSVGFACIPALNLLLGFELQKMSSSQYAKIFFFTAENKQVNDVFPFTNYHKRNLHTLMYSPSNVRQTTVSLSSVCQVVSPFTIHPPRPTTTNSGPAAPPRGARTPYIYTHKYALLSRSSYQHIASSKVCSVSRLGNGHGR